MFKATWKSTALLTAVSLISLGLLLFAVVGTFSLPLFEVAGLISWFLLVVLTLPASHLTVQVTNTEGVGFHRKSIADGFVFLAVVLFAAPPANATGPAVLLAAVVGFVSTFRHQPTRAILFTTGTAVISTSIAAALYGVLVEFFAGGIINSSQPALPLGILLIPLLSLAVVQYCLNTVTTAWFLSIDAGKISWLPSQESVVWTLTTQFAGAASAVLFYLSIVHRDFSYALLGLLISGLTHMLYLFNERRLDEVRRAEAERRRHVEEMATIHMNTIESLAIAIDAKDQTTHGHVRRTQIYATQMGKLFKVTESELQALLAGA
jgi:hypothetical protein